MLDLGRGFARFAWQAGADSVAAIDVSRKTVGEAIRLTNDPNVT
jgi:predicted rRNA methylase YqxC with S4 and FtsJ domains